MFVIVGASTGLGRSLATRFAAAGHDLVVISSDGRDISATAADLAIRFGRRVEPLAADITDAASYVPALERAAAVLGRVDGVVLPVGAVSDEDDGRDDPAGVDRIMRTNFTAVVNTVSCLWPAVAAGGGTIVGFGSVAASRGRSSNIVYSAAKRALASYFESLRHRARGTRVVVQFYVVGYLDTALAYGRRTPLRPASPDALAARVLRDLSRDFGVGYYPSAWRWITLALRLLPWPFFKRLAF